MITRSDFDRPAARSAAVWLFFLFSPALIVAVADMSPCQRAMSLILVGLTGPVFVAGHSYRGPLYEREWANLALWLTPLLLLTAALSCFIGPWAATMLPFVTSVASSVARFRYSAWVNLTVIVAYGVYVAFTGGPNALLFFGFMAPIAAIVGAQVASLRINEERAQLSTELRLAHQRESISRDIHDLLGHSLTAINVKSSLALKLLDRDPQRARQEVEEVVELSRAALDDVRAAVYGSHTPTLARELSSATSSLQAAGITPQIDADPDVESPLFAWALREAVTNVIRHSRADACRITVTPQRLMVADNGVGIQKGTSLSSLSSRIDAAGARLRVSSPVASTGTVVEVTV